MGKSDCKQHGIQWEATWNLPIPQPSTVNQWSFAAVNRLGIITANRCDAGACVGHAQIQTISVCRALQDRHKMVDESSCSWHESFNQRTIPIGTSWTPELGFHEISMDDQQHYGIWLPMQSRTFPRFKSFINCMVIFSLTTRSRRSWHNYSMYWESNLAGGCVTDPECTETEQECDSRPSKLISQLQHLHSQIQYGSWRLARYTGSE